MNDFTLHSSERVSTRTVSFVVAVAVTVVAVAVVVVSRVFFFFLIVKFPLLFSCGILILLVFRNQVVHVGFSFGEFHFVHTLASVPMEESLATEHRGELLADAFEQCLDGGTVSNEGACHL